MSFYKDTRSDQTLLSMGSCGSAGIKHATEGGEIENLFSRLFFQVTCPEGTWKYWKYQQQIKKKIVNIICIQQMNLD